MCKCGAFKHATKIYQSGLSILFFVNYERGVICYLVIVGTRPGKSLKIFASGIFERKFPQKGHKLKK